MPITEAEYKAAAELAPEHFIAILAHLPERMKNHRRDAELRSYAERYHGIPRRQRALRIVRDIEAATPHPEIDIGGTLNFIASINGCIPSDATIRAALAH